MSRGWIAGGIILKICCNRKKKPSEYAPEKTSLKVKVTISINGLEKYQPCGQQICRAARNHGTKRPKISIGGDEAVHSKTGRFLPRTSPCTHAEWWLKAFGFLVETRETSPERCDNIGRQ